MEAADYIAGFLADCDLDQFRESELLRSAVAQKLAVIGEAASHVSADIRDRNAVVPWAQIVAFRNILTHAYFSVDWEIVWRTATVRCPELRQQIAQILDGKGERPDRG
ncbi:MAG: HepT-like ribonuclease domain-containing protein [Terriglobales bacterium]